MTAKLNARPSRPRDHSEGEEDNWRGDADSEPNDDVLGNVC